MKADAEAARRETKAMVNLAMAEDVEDVEEIARPTMTGRPARLQLAAGKNALAGNLGIKLG